MDKLLLRWCLGIQDTTRLDSFRKESGLLDLIWLAKLSIASFQRWFPEARFMLFYNGEDLDQFGRIFDSIKLPLSQELEFVHQTKLLGQDKFKNPYHYIPQGVWWKWIPFRFDESYHEISIDTDIICIREPRDWMNWIEGDEEIILAPERFPEIVVNTCGDFYRHPVLQGKKPLNCGIVGHRAGHDYSKRFFEITREIRYGYTYDSLFITEQGAINVWAYSLELEGKRPYILDFEKCAWVRDFVYYLEKGVKVETVHATTWHKRIIKDLQSILERRVLEDYSDEQFLFDLIAAAKNLDSHSQYVFRRQLGVDRKRIEFF